MTNEWLFNTLGDDELFEDGYFFNLSSGDIIEVTLDSSMGTSDPNLEILSHGGSLDDSREKAQSKVTFCNSLKYCMYYYILSDT